MTKTGTFNLTSLIILICSVLFFGGLSVYFGQDANWDLANYHYYNPWALLNGRLGFDYAPAQIQTYLNPLVDVPFYYLATHLPPKAVGFVLGGLHGINLWLVYLIAYEIFPFNNNAQRVAASLALGLTGVYAPGFLSELGTTFNDNLVSLFALISLLLVIRENCGKTRQRGSQWPMVFVPGLIMGFGVGLKLTLAVFAVGALAAMSVLYTSWKDRFTSFIIYGAGIAGGFILTSGYWMVMLWKKFQSPLFPFYNAIFKSPYYALINYSDTHFLPKNIFQFLKYPLYFGLENTLVMETRFRDMRFPIIYLLLILAAIIAIYILSTKKKPTFGSDKYHLNDRIAFFVIAFFAVTFVVWQTMFSIYRYIVGLELLGPLVITLLLSFIIRKFFLRLVAAIILFAVIIIGVKTPDWGRAAWSESFFGVELPKMEAAKETLVVMTGGAPTSYVIPFFPTGTRFVRVQSNFHNPEDQTKLQFEIRDVIKKQTGPIYLLTTINQAVEIAENMIKAYQLKIKPQGCAFIKSKLQDDPIMCRLERD